MYQGFTLARSYFFSAALRMSRQSAFSFSNVVAGAFASLSLSLSFLFFPFHLGGVAVMAVLDDAVAAPGAAASGPPGVVCFFGSSFRSHMPQMLLAMK